MVDEDTWRRRFYLFMSLRLFGLLVFLGGFAIAFTGLIRPGGWPGVGAVMILAGVAEAIVAPRLLRKHWREADGEG